MRLLRNFACLLALAVLLSTGGCGNEQPQQPQGTPVAGQPQNTQINSALPDSAFKAALKPVDPPARMRAGEKKVVQVTVSNQSPNAWPAMGAPNGRFAITLRNRWLAPDGKKVVNDMDGGSSLPQDIPPGGTANMTLKITAPKERGEYLLEFDMVQEQVNFFHDRGSQPTRVKVTVE